MTKRKNNKYKIFVLFFILFSIPCCQRTTNAPKDYPEIKDAGVLHIVMDYSPSGFFRSGDSISGQQYEMAMLLSEYLNIPIEIHLESGLQKSIDGLKSGKYDLIARLIPVTSELKESIAFTENMTLDRQVLVQRKATDTTTVFVRNQLELPGKKIYVAYASPSISRLENLANEIGDTLQITEMPDYESAHLLILVAKGEIDYAVCDYQTALKMLADYPVLDISTGISFSQLHAWAVRKESPELLDSINEWIRGVTIKFEKK